MEKSEGTVPASNYQRSEICINCKSVFQLRVSDSSPSFKWKELNTVLQITDHSVDSRRHSGTLRGNILSRHHMSQTTFLKRKTKQVLDHKTKSNYTAF